MIDLNFTPKTFVFIIAGTLIVVWAMTYIAAALSQLLFIVIALLVLVVVYAAAVRCWRALTGQRRSGGRRGGSR